MRWVYSLGIALYGLGIRVAALWNSKAEQWVAGRENLYAQLERDIGPTDHPLWFHCASLGEFEQGRPLLERIKRERPERKILLSFFSPSGYEVQKRYPLADYVCYLPLDTPQNMKRFVERVRPAMLLLIKYEFWANLLAVLQQAQIPVYSVCATFREEQFLFKPQGRYLRAALQGITHFFVQDTASQQRLEKLQITQVLCAGDTRYDRVMAVRSEQRELDFLREFKGDQALFIAGSTWKRDEALLLALIEENPEGVKYLIAPHEIDEHRIQQLLKNLRGKAVVRYSQLGDTGDLHEARILLLDTLGLLTHSYAYGTLTYVGGGFGKRGVHNVLEPAVFGNPVLFGPVYQQFIEARGLLQAQAAISVSDAAGFLAEVQSLLSDGEKRRSYGSNARAFVERRAGATDEIYNFLKTRL